MKYPGRARQAYLQICGRGFTREEERQMIRGSFLVICFLVFAHTAAEAQGWTNAGPLPHPVIQVSGTYDPANATPFWRGWTKLVYVSNLRKILWYGANPNCCGGTFSNAMFFYDTATNKWSLAWSHNTTTAAGPSGGALADALDAPSDKH